MSGATATKHALRGTAAEQPEPAAAPEVKETEGAQPVTPPKTVQALDDGTFIVCIENAFRPHTGTSDDPAFGLAKVKVHEMYAGDLIAMDMVDGDQAKMFALIKQLTKLPGAVIERMHWEDYGRLYGVVNEKLGNFLGTTRKPL